VLRLSGADHALINGPDDSFFDLSISDAVETQRFGGN
jgi:hypothetical protein